ncbi:MAG: hypothetical protein JHC95_19255, partial [Solirubrobacteraceae bacterium]|nr:hypothetical protein [Solirubrobacteraceae bacterium]
MVTSRRPLGRFATALATAAATLLVVAPGTQAFGGPMDASGAGEAAGGVAIAARTGGGATTAWRRGSDGALLARSVTVGGTLGTPVVVATGTTARPPAAARVPGGTALAWTRASDDHLLVRRLGDDGSLGTTFDASGTSLSQINGQAALAANASGRVAVAWRRPNDSEVRARVFEIDTGPSAPAVNLTATPDIALFGTNVQVTINDAGEAAVVWHRNTDCHIIARRVTSAGAVGTQLDISGEPDSAIGDTSPTVTLRPNGDLVAGWHRDSDHHAVTRRWNADGSAGTVVDLSPLGDVPSMANMAISPIATGEAMAWQRGSDGHVVLASGSASAVSALTNVSGGPSATDVPPALARTQDDALAVAWIAAGGTVRLAFETGVPGPDPVPPGGTAPPSTPPPTAG